MMAGIGQVDTAPELAVRRYLHSSGLRLRLNDRRLPGRPDIVLAGPCIAVFVHGCFWHRHGGCWFGATPATNSEFWKRKFESNVRRDATTAAQLDLLRWVALVVWECETQDQDRLDRLYWTIRARSQRASKPKRLMRGGQTYLCNLVPLANDVTEPCKMRESMHIVQPGAAASPPHPNTKSCLPRDDCPRRSDRSPAQMSR